MRDLRTIFILLNIFFCLLIIIFNREVYGEISNSDNTLIINEIMANPVGDDSIGEWVEIYNPSNQIIELSNFTLNTKALDNYELHPLEIIILARNPNSLMQSHPNLINTVLSLPISLNNSNLSLSLTDKNGVIISTIEKYNSIEGISYEKLVGNCNTYSNHPTSHTIGTQNSLCNNAESESPNTDSQNSEVNSFNILINEIQQCEQRSQITILNLDTKAIDLTDWILEIDDSYQYYFSNKIESMQKFSIEVGRIGKIYRLIDKQGFQKDIFVGESNNICMENIDTYKTDSNFLGEQIVKKELNAQNTLKHPKIYYQ